MTENNNSFFGQIDKMLAGLQELYMVYIALKIFLIMFILMFLVAPAFFNVIYVNSQRPDQREFAAYIHKVYASGYGDDLDKAYLVAVRGELVDNARKVENDNSYWGQHPGMTKLFSITVLLGSIIFMVAYISFAWRHKIYFVLHILWCLVETIIIFTGRIKYNCLDFDYMLWQATPFTDFLCSANYVIIALMVFGMLITWVTEQKHEKSDAEKIVNAVALWSVSHLLGVPKD